MTGSGVVFFFGLAIIPIIIIIPVFIYLFIYFLLFSVSTGGIRENSHSQAFYYRQNTHSLRRMSSGLSARRLILQQLTAVAQYSPFRPVLAAMLANHTAASTMTASLNDHGGSKSKSSWLRISLISPESSRGTFTLMTEEEMGILRPKQKE
ncbi:chaperone DnaJ protein, putative, partial [Trypanosoma cruzi]